MVGGSRCCHPRLSFSGDDALSLKGKYKRARRGSSPTAQDKKDARRFVDLVSFLPAFRVGRGVYVASSKIGRFVSGIKRPVHTMLATRGYFSPLAVRAGYKTSLALRKRVGLGLLGYSLVNPMENLRYISKRDWERLLWNYHLPVVGVPIYNRFFDSKGSGSPRSASPTEPIYSSLPPRISAQQRKDVREFRRGR